MKRLLAVAALALAACGGSSKDTTPTATDLATLCASFSNKLLGLEQTCWKTNPAILTAPGPFQDSGLCSQLQVEVTAGRVHYDSAQATACIAAVQALPCTWLFDELRPVPAECKAALTGTVANGGNCYMGDNCSNGFCTADYTLACPGKCQAFIAAGGNCDAAECAAGLACDYGGNPSTCKTPNGAGLPCPCKDGLWCDGGLASPICKTPIPTGGACSGNGCAVGNECTGYPSATCQALVGLNGACSATAPCGWGYWCSASKCVSFPSVGQACAGAYGCIGGYCDTATASPTCKAYLADGAACTSYEQCVSGNCDFTPMNCAPASTCGP
jgi:hypothetical protein